MKKEKKKKSVGKGNRKSTPVSQDHPFKSNFEQVNACSGEDFAKKKTKYLTDSYEMERSILTSRGY